MNFAPNPLSEFAPELLTNHIALVAEDAGEVVGCVYAAAPSDDHGFVFGLYVIPSLRRRGIAQALMAAVTQGLQEQGKRFVVLSVDSPNAPARALYERLGFVDQARILRANIEQLLRGR